MSVLKLDDLHFITVMPQILMYCIYDRCLTIPQYNNGKLFSDVGQLVSSFNHSGLL